MTSDILKAKAAGGYSLVGLACAFCGFALRKTNSMQSPNFHDILVGLVPNNFSEIAPLILFALVVFSYLIVLQYVLEDKPASAAELKFKQKSTASYSIVVFVVLTSVCGFLIFSTDHGAGITTLQIAALVIPFFFHLYMTWHFLKSHIVGSNATENQAFKFYNRVFAPALSLVVATFLFGWLLAKPDLVDSIVALFVMAVVGAILIYRSRQKEFNPRISIAVYFGTIMLSPFIFGISKKLDGTTSNTVLAVLTGLFLAYCLGVTEVANRFHFASHADEEKKLWLPSTESADFYHAGANWAGFVFIPTLPLLALFHQHIPVWSVFAYSFVLTIAWCKKDKSTSTFRKRSIILGLLMPVTIILGTILARTSPEWAYLVPLPANSSISMSDRVATILGVLLTVVFVLLQSDFSNLSRNLRNVRTYIDLRNCYLLYFLAASFVNLYAVVVGSVSPQSVDGLDPAAFSRKIQELQVLSLASIVVVLVIFFWTEEQGSEGDGDDTKKIESGGTGVAKRKSNIDKIRLSLETGRPAISAIAGLVTVALTGLANSLSMVQACLAGMLMMFVTLFGFIINDVYDVQKDIRGLRADKHIASGRLELSTAKFAAIAFFVIACVIALVGFGWSIFSFVVLLSLGLIVYSPFSAMFPFAKGIYTAALCLSPLLLQNILTGKEVVSWWFFAFGVVFFVGREMTFDVIDFESDQRSGLKTVAVLLGPVRANSLGWLLMFLAMFILLIYTNSSAQILAGIGLFALLGCWAYGLHSKLGASYWSRVPMALGALSVAVSL